MDICRWVETSKGQGERGDEGGKGGGEVRGEGGRCGLKLERLFVAQRDRRKGGGEGYRGQGAGWLRSAEYRFKPNP